MNQINHKNSQRNLRLVSIGLCSIALLVGVVVASGTRADQTSRGTNARQTIPLEQRVVLDWYKLTLELVRHTPTYSPPVAARAFGYLGVALYETVAGLSGKLRSLVGQVNGLTNLPQPETNAVYDDAVALNSTISTMVRALFSNTGPTGQRALEAVGARLERTLGARSVRNDIQERSRVYGRAVANAILAWASTDGGAVIENLGFPLEYKANHPWEWVPTSLIPLQQAPLLPNWGRNRPFVLPHGNACPVRPHPPYSEDRNSVFFKAALEVFEISRTLTREQASIARFWADDPMQSFTPAGHWIAILTQVLEDQPGSLERLAEAYARLGMALADAFIGCWFTKYQYNLLRPITFIRRLIDPGWNIEWITPPFPEYPSGHSTQSGAAAVVLTALFGESFAFEDRSKLEDGMMVRSYPSFWAAAEEAAMSRLYGGIHYRFGVDNGLEQGRCIGATVMRLRLRR